MPTAARDIPDPVLAHRVDQVDDYHGTAVADPYRWLEDPRSAETNDWVTAQNSRTESYLGQIPFYGEIRARIEELWDFPRYSAPRKQGDALYYQKNDGLQDQAVLYRRVGDGKPEVVLDPNQLSQDGAVALLLFHITEDASLMAYSLTESGSDWQTIRVRDLATLEDRSDEIHWVKFTSVAWHPDDSGFFYSRFPEEGSIPGAPPSTHQKVYWHLLGTTQEADQLVFERPDDPDLGFEPSITDDDRYLLIHTWRGTDRRHGLYYRPVDTQTDFIQLLADGEAKFDFAGSHGSVFYFLTDLDAPLGRIISIDVDRSDRANWQEVVPEGSDTLELASIMGGKLVLLYMQDASHRVRLLGLDGAGGAEVELPGIGSIAELTGRPKQDQAYLGFQSQLFPPMILELDVETANTSVYEESSLGFDPSPYEVTQLFAPAEGDVLIPMFVTHRKEIARDGTNPTLMYGYGGFDISLTPAFSPSRIAFLERGGIVVDANLRGGGEYGEEWHRAGMLEKKQRVFDDFVAVAEYLIGQGWTGPDRLAIFGGSNGGLLVAACVLQRPELFGAAVAAVPVADMLRYHRFTAGRHWLGEYGNAEEDPDHFRFLAAYSPVHNVEPDDRRPPILVTTAESDDRVVPMHAWKLAAALGEEASGEQLILLRTERRAGHGLGKPTSKVIDEATDIYTFLWDTIGR